MAFASGQRLGPYEIGEPLGAGGMGDLYRAVDTRLGRTVAIKVMADKLVRDPDMQQRFQREARASASLNHPHICALFDVGEHEGATYLVMEYLEGETLAQRLDRRAAGSGRPVAAEAVDVAGASVSRSLSIDETLRYAIQITDALARAHQAGLVHRDVKPANIMITRAGIKLLDFGLAKRLPARPSNSPDPVLSAPTKVLTEESSIMGSLPYMAPEQVEGREADARTDIFGFACVLYEMLTGKRPFTGRSQAALIAALLEHEPISVSTLRPEVPRALSTLIGQCLAKDPAERWQSAADVHRLLRSIAEGALSSTANVTGEAGPMRRVRQALVFAAGLMAGLALLWGLRVRPQQPAASQRWSFEVPIRDLARSDAFSLSRDGRRLAYIASDEQGRAGLWIRFLDTPNTKYLEGTFGARGPFWSPDGARVAFGVAEKLKVVHISSGLVQEICPTGAGYSKGAWSPDGARILFASQNEGLTVARPTDGSTTTLSLGPGRRGMNPRFTDDGRFLFSITDQKTWSDTIYLGRFDGKPPVAVTEGTVAELIGSLLIFNHQKTLYAQPIDLTTGKLVGERRSLVERVAGLKGVVSFSATPQALAYTTSATRMSQLVWFERDGTRRDPFGPPMEYTNFDLSPDGSLLAFETPDDQNRPTLWIKDARANVPDVPLSRRIAGDPVWSADGRRLIFGAFARSEFTFAKEEVSGLFMTTIGGTEQTSVLKEERQVAPEDWSRDGRWSAIKYAVGREGAILDMNTGQTTRFGERFENVDEMQFSPDGRWMAFNGLREATWHVYVTAVPPGTSEWQVSKEPGGQPRWGPDGRELFFLSFNGTLNSVEIPKGDEFRMGARRVLFTLPLTPAAMRIDQYSVGPDGRFLVKLPLIGGRIEPIHVVVNWPAILDE
jgi:eukaryotic-like serine/threonine-protein kinase